MRTLQRQGPISVYDAINPCNIRLMAVTVQIVVVGSPFMVTKKSPANIAGLFVYCISLRGEGAFTALSAMAWSRFETWV